MHRQYRVRHFASPWLFILSLAFQSSFASANMVYWDGGHDQNWTTAANWSSAPNLPGSSDDVFLDELPYGSPYTVTLSSGTQSINSLTTDATSSLTVSGATLSIAAASQIHSTFNFSIGTLGGAGNITSAGTFNLTGGTMSGSGTTIVSSSTSPNTATLSLSGNITLDRTLENDGSATWGGNNILFFNSGTFNNYGTFTANGTPEAQGVAGTDAFNNAGSFIKQGTGTITFVSSGASIPFNNSGTVDVQAGTLQLFSGGTETGAFTIENGATLQLGGSFTFSSATSLGGAGNLTFGNYAGTTTDPAPVNIGGTSTFSNGTVTFSAAYTGGSALIISGGTVNFNGATSFASGALTLSAGTATFNSPVTFSSGTVSGGTLGGSGNVIFASSLSWTYGTMSGSGTTIVSSSTSPNTATLSLSGNITLDRTLENDGSATWSGNYVISFNGGTFNNYGTLTASGTPVATGVSGVDVFNNTGSFVKQGTGLVGFYMYTGGATPVALTFNNTGTVDVQAGTLQLSGGVTQLPASTLTGGTWDILNNATLNITTGSNITAIASAASVLLDGANSVFAKINSLTTNQGTFTITDGRNFVPTSAFSNSGTIRIGPSSTFEATTALTNTGIIDVAGGTLKLDSGLGSGTVRAQLLSGFNFGAWNGTGIISSLAAADPNHATGVGYVINGSAYTLVDTWYGDTNLDGVVNAGDLSAMSSTGTTWATGDFNYDGVVNADDYALFMLGDAEQSGSFPNVPEPAGLALFALQLVGLRRQR